MSPQIHGNFSYAVSLDTYFTVTFGHGLLLFLGEVVVRETLFELTKWRKYWKHPNGTLFLKPDPFCLYSTDTVRRPK